MDRRRLLIIFIIVFVDVLGFGLILPLLPYYATELGASPSTIGLLVASYAAAQLVGVPLLGRASDIVGRRPILVLSILGSTAGFLVLGFASSLPMLFAGRIIDGLSGGTFIVAQSYISDVTGPRERARGLGLTGAAFGLGFITGPAMGGALSTFGYSVPAFVAAGVALSNVALVLLLLPETLTRERKVLLASAPRSGFTLAKLLEALSRPVFGPILTVRFFFWLAFALFQGTFSQWSILALGLTPRGNGLVLGYVGLISVLVQLVLIGPLTRRFAETRLVVAALASGAICFALWGFSPNLAVLLAVLAPLGVSVAVENTVVSSLISKSVEPHEIGGAFGLAGGLQSIGSIVGPIAGGVMLESVGVWAPGLLAGLIAAALLPYAALYVAPRFKAAPVNKPSAETT